MSRPWRITFPGAIYPMTNRGNAQAAIYADDADRRAFVDLLTQIVQRYHWVCHAYCLMDNHYRLLIETPEGNLSQGARQLNGVYTQQYNRRQGRVGHVLQGRYKAILVEKWDLGSGLELSLFTCPSPGRAALHCSPRSPRERDDESPASFCRGLDSCFTLQVLLFPQPRGRKNRTHDFLHQCRQVRLCETDVRRWHAVVLDVGWDMLVVWRGTGQLRDMSKQRG